MADSPISLLPAYNPPIGTDLLAIVDVTNGITKKVTVTDLLALAPPSGIALTDLSALGPLTYDNTTGVFSTSMATNRLIGRSTAGTGQMEQIIIGSGLSLAAGTLTATGVGVPSGTDGQTLRYDSSNVLVANSILKNDGNDVFVGDGSASKGRLFSTINHLSQHNITLKNTNAAGSTLIEFQNNSGTEQYEIGMASGNLQFIIPTGMGLSLDTNGKVKVTQNNASYYDILTLQNLNSSAPVYLDFLNSASTERFYLGLRQSSDRLDIICADNGLGIMVDATGRTLIGGYSNVYQAPDSGAMLTVASRSPLGLEGVVLRNSIGSGGVPIKWKMENLATSFVQYAEINGVVVSNATGAHTGKIVFSTATAGTVTDKIVIDSTGNITPTTTGVGALGTTSLKWLELVVTNPVAVIYGGTGKTSVAANKFLVALSANTYSEAGFFNVAEQTLSTTPTFTAGTAPSGATTHTYRWDQIGDRVTVRVNLIYATPGATVTRIFIPFPSDLPAPAVPSGFSGGSSILYYGAGGGSNGISAVVGNIARSYVRRNSANTGWEFVIDTTSAATNVYWVNITYHIT